MRFSIIAAVAAFSSTALAQGLLDQIPKCAQTCFGSNLGTCSLVDIACICSAKTLDPVSCCVFASCSQTDIAATIQFGVQICKLQNINVNTQPSCPSGSATLSGSATPSAGNSTVAPATGSASTTPTSSASRTSASVAGSTGAAHHQGAGAGVGLGMAMFGLLAAL